jgi:integrase
MPVKGNLRKGFEFEEAEILTVEKARETMRLCEETPKYNCLTLYIALQLFAGLRPFEALKIKWEDINEKTGRIFVRKEISKAKKNRNPKMNPTMSAWVHSWYGEKKGFVAPQKNFENLIKQFRFDLGYDVVLFKSIKEPLI